MHIWYFSNRLRENLQTNHPPTYSAYTYSLNLFRLFLSPPTHILIPQATGPHHNRTGQTRTGRDIPQSHRSRTAPNTKLHVHKLIGPLNKETFALQKHPPAYTSEILTAERSGCGAPHLVVACMTKDPIKGFPLFPLFVQDSICSHVPPLCLLGLFT